MSVYSITIVCSDGHRGVIVIPRDQMSGRTLALAMDRAMELERTHGGQPFPASVVVSLQPLERIA